MPGEVSGCCILLLYMAALRTQIYLTAEQRGRLDALRQSRGESLAELIRAAVDEFLDRERLDLATALELSFGAVPGLEVPPRSEWGEREGFDSR